MDDKQLEALEPIYKGLGVHTSFGEGCAHGHWTFVTECLSASKDNGRTLLKRNPNCLRDACANARPRVVAVLLKYSTKRLINAGDISGTAPILEVIRCNGLDLCLRIACMKLLLSHPNINVCKADKLGDTILHWGVRLKEFSLLKTLFDFAGTNKCHLYKMLFLRNGKSKSPIDLAVTPVIQKYLSQRAAESRVYLKLTVLHEDSLFEMRSKKQLHGDLLAEMTEKIQQHSDLVHTLCNTKKIQAEKARQLAEKQFIQAAIERSVEQTNKWLTGSQGSNEVKILMTSIKEDLIILEETKYETNEDVERVQNEARKKAIQKITRRKQNEAKSKALTEFRKINPPVET